MTCAIGPGTGNSSGDRVSRFVEQGVDGDGLDQLETSISSSKGWPTVGSHNMGWDRGLFMYTHLL